MSHTWKFFRTGGFDQVRIDTAADLLNLRELDQKLWVALSCPTTGIEFDARTLALIDSDGDGHIRAPELLGAIDWAAARLTDAAVLEQALAGVPLAAIKDETILAAAKGLLPAGEAMVTVEAASAAEAEYSARALAAWEASGADSKPLGEATEAACAALAAVKEKLDDFFVRCRLAAFDDRAGGAMNASDDSLKSLGAATLSAEHADIAALPLAKVPSGTQSAGAGGTAPLAAGVNPAWAARMATLRDAAVTPVLGARESLSEADWAELQARLAPFTAWQAARPAGLPAEAEAVRDLERLSRYVRDLMTLANNFVAFRNFYARQGKATFQIGTLYLDGRAAELCVAVNDAARHAALASLSRICLVYCDCVRVGGNGGEKLSIAAAFTAGDSDQLRRCATACSTTARDATGTPPSPRCWTTRSACARPSGRPTRSSAAWSPSRCRRWPPAAPRRPKPRRPKPLSPAWPRARLRLRPRRHSTPASSPASSPPSASPSAPSAPRWPRCSPACSASRPGRSRWRSPPCCW
jgi:hypothetical protein